MSLFALDAVSNLVKAGSDLKIAELEKRLAEEGFRLPYWTPPKNDATLGEALMQRLPNLYQAAFGGIDELCVQVEWRLNNGELASNVLTPRSATGPSLKNLLVGSGKYWGKPEAAVLKIFRVPPENHAIALRFGIASRREAFRASLQKLGVKFPLLAPLSGSDLREWIPAESVGEFFLGLVLWGRAEFLAPLLQLIRGLAESRQGAWLEFHDDEAALRLTQKIRESAIQEWQETRIAEGFEDPQRLLKMMPR